MALVPPQTHSPAPVTAPCHICHPKLLSFIPYPSDTQHKSSLPYTSRFLISTSSPTNSPTLGQCQGSLRKVNTFCYSSPNGLRYPVWRMEFSCKGTKAHETEVRKRNLACCLYPSVCSPRTPTDALPISSMPILCLPVTLRLALPGQLQRQRLYPQTGQVQAFMRGQQQGTFQAVWTWAPGTALGLPSQLALLACLWLSDAVIVPH